MCDDCRIDANNPPIPQALNITDILRHSSSQKNPINKYLASQKRLKSDSTIAMHSHHDANWIVKKHKSGLLPRSATVYSIGGINNPDPTDILIHADFTGFFGKNKTESPTWIFVHRTADARCKTKNGKGAAGGTEKEPSNVTKKCCVKAYLNPITSMWKQKTMKITCKNKGV